jgi:hypothetical protein
VEGEQTMFKVVFYIDGSLLTTLELPIGSPLPFPGSTVELDNALYEVVALKYEYGAFGEPPSVTIRLEDF